MTAQTFAEFVASQQGAAQDSIDGTDVDWADVRRQWLKDLESLHSRIIEFLKEFLETGLIQYSFTDVTLTEEDIGTYSAKRMDIAIGRQHIFLEPIGTLFIGYRGRVDVVGSAGRAQLVLVPQEARSAADLVTIRVGVNAIPLVAPTKTPTAWVWKIVSHGVRGEFAELEKDSFFSVLMEIAGA